MIIQKIVRLFAQKFMPKLAYPIITGPLKGIKFIHGALVGPSLGASVYLNKIEKKQTNEFIYQVKPEDIVFDIGANVGYYTMLASRIVGEKGKVFSFEPVVRNLVYLYNHIKLNKLKNVVILPFACSEESELELFLFGPNFAQGHIENNFKILEFDSESQTFVNTITIDKFTSISGVMPNIIKIDVEGSELFVLKGAKETMTKHKPKIFLSIHSNDLEIICKEYLKDFSYQFILLDEKERPSVEYLCY
ncbi:MAG: FkbM family methyltransferase [Ignavibacteriales bacterium]|nr:FkbM family methyltransferase [Ignavibacteriales bacterium]